MLTKRVKENVLKDNRRHDSDTGSPEAQDFHSRRGLLQMVADRRKHLKYLEKKDEKSYNALIKKLGLKR